MKKLYTTIVIFCLAAMQSFAQNCNDFEVGGVATFASDSITCDATGEIAVVKAGIPPFSYLWHDNNATTSVRTGMCPGPYVFTITDSAGCSKTDSIHVVGIDPNDTCAGFHAKSIVLDLSAANACDGAVEVFADGGRMPYSYMWHDTSLTDKMRNNLCAGQYVVDVFDSLGCFAMDTIDIVFDTMPGPGPNCNLSINFTNVVNPADSISCDGTVTADVQGGVAPYQFHWMDDTLINSATRTSLCEGMYFVNVTDSAGCAITDSIYLGGSTGPGPGPNPCDVEGGATASNASDSLTCDGSAEIIVVKGVPPFMFKWMDDTTITTQTRSGLCAGGYYFEIIDSAGCVYQDSVYVGYFDPQNPCDNYEVHTTQQPLSAANACDGSAEAHPTNGMAPYSYSWADSIGSPVANTKTVDLLCEGMYVVTVIDSAQCTGTDTVYIGFDPGPAPNCNVQIVFDSVSNPIDSTNCNGFILTSVFGGVPPYTYKWDDDTLLNDANRFSLCEGFYHVTVKDSLGCESNQGAQLDYSSTGPGPNPNPCDVDGGATAGNTSDSLSCDGTAEIVVTKGVPPFMFKWMDDTTITSQTRSGLCSGPYHYEIMDSTGCVFYDSVYVGFFDPQNPCDNFIVHTTQAPLSAANACDGSAEVFPSNGRAPYTYHWTDTASTTVGATKVITSLCEGIYAVDVTDSAGCTGTDTVQIYFDPGPGPNCNFSISFANVTPVSDSISCDGSVDAHVNGGGAPPFQFHWMDDTLINSSSRTGLCEGMYVLNVTDSVGCAATDSIFIGGSTGPGPGPNPCDVDGGATASNASDSLTCDGSAEIVVVKGVPPFMFKWMDDTTITSQTRSGLCSGGYYFEIIDSAGCVYQDSVYVGYFDPQNPCDNYEVHTTQQPLSAANACDGSAEAHPTNGMAPYSYSWADSIGSPVANTKTVDLLCEGMYVVTVIDSAQCTGTDTVYIGFDPGPAPNCNITVDFTGVVYPTDSASCDGMISANVNGGGVPPFMFRWDDDTLLNVATRSGLCEDFYHVIVKDSVGCEASQGIQLDAPTGPGPNPNPCGIEGGATANNASDSLTCDGTAEIVVTNGIPPFTFKWMDDTTINAQTRSGLCPGPYHFEIMDSAGCVKFDSVYVGFFDPQNPCDNYEVHSSHTPLSAANACDGTAEAHPTNGMAPYSYSWTDSAGSPVANTKTIDQLCEGMYIVTVIDSAQCTGSDTVYIGFDQGPGPNCNLNAIMDGQNANDSVNCNGQAYVLNTTGGIPPYMYRWDDDTTITSPQRGGLCPGSYGVTIKDSAGCEIHKTFNVFFDAPRCNMYLDFSYADNTAQPCNGSVQVMPQGGVAPYHYRWEDDTLLNVATRDSLCPGAYKVHVKDSLGCVVFGEEFVGNGGAPTNGPCSTFEVGAIVNSESQPGACNGMADLVIKAGTPPFNIQWMDTSLTTPTRHNLCNGVYMYSVIDSFGCTVTDSLHVFTLDTLNPCVNFQAHAVKQPISQPNACDAVLEAFANGGTPPFTFAWSDGSTDRVRNNVCVGSYAVVVTDSFNCTATDSVYIDPVAFAPPSNDPCEGFKAYAASLDENTAGSCDGEAEAIVIEGNPPFTIAWADGGDSTKVRTGLCAGVYAFTVTDSAGCTATDTAKVFTFNVVNPCDNFDVQLAADDQSVPGACNGSVEAFVIGGKAPFTYDWLGSNVANKKHEYLCGGYHSVTVTDANNCTSTDTAFVGTDTVINFNPCKFFEISTISINQSDSTTCDGYVEVVTHGSNGSLNIKWLDDSTNTTQYRNNACKGVYRVVVNDSLGCIDSARATVGVMPQPAPLPPADTIKPLKLFVDAFDVNNNALCNGVAVGYVLGGVPPYKFSFGTDTSVTDMFTVDSLCAGFYTMDVSDSIDNHASFVFVIGSPVTTFVPLVQEFKDSLMKDTLVTPATPDCAIDYDNIDSIVINSVSFIGLDSASVVWAVHANGGTTAKTQSYYIGNSSGVFTFVLDLYCTSRLSGNAKGLDTYYIQERVDTTGGSTPTTPTTPTTGIDEVGNEVHIQAYPNPFSEQITLVLDEAAVLIISDAYGREIYRTSQVSGTVTINTETWIPGVYIITTDTGASKVLMKTK